MTDILKQQIMAALATVNDPDQGKDIVSLKMIDGLHEKEGHVSFAIVVDPKKGAQMEPLRKQAEAAVHSLPGVLSVSAVLTAERAAQAPQGKGKGKAKAQGPMLPDAKSIIAVASGKGGVGKSTVAANLALGLAAKGLRVGLLDADIYGPSIPRMLGVSKGPESSDGVRLDPVEAHGVKCMSIGFFVEEESPVIWRGPMVQSALVQMMRDVNWGVLDVLVADMPPGTGDVQLTMAQQVPLTGAVIVSTPQDIALADARKGLNMFRKVDVPVLGLIENMSYFLCPNCGDRTEIFGHGGARKEADILGMEFLGEIPLHVEIRTTSDGGYPITASDPDNEHSQSFKKIADRLWEKTKEQLDEQAAATPNIVVQ